jgi:signal transduction histidine kinase
VAVGYAQLLRQQSGETDNGDPPRALARLEEALRTMHRLVNDLLDATRIGANRFVIRPAPMDLGELARQVAEEQQAAGGGHQFVVDAPAGVVGEWDAERLGQVLANLVSNAVKYSPDGTEVRIRVRQSDEAVLLSVADRGAGIAASQIDQLFQPFARLGRERQATGTGLGLYIAKGIVEAHGGRIWVESSPGHGSTFSMSLPRRPANAP